MPVLDTRLIQEGMMEVGHEIMKRSVDHTVLETLAVAGTCIFGVGGFIYWINHRQQQKLMYATLGCSNHALTTNITKDREHRNRDSANIKTPAILQSEVDLPNITRYQATFRGNDNFYKAMSFGHTNLCGLEMLVSANSYRLLGDLGWDQWPVLRILANAPNGYAIRHGIVSTNYDKGGFSVDHLFFLEPEISNMDRLQCDKSILSLPYPQADAAHHDDKNPYIEGSCSALRMREADTLNKPHISALLGSIAMMLLTFNFLPNPLPVFICCCPSRCRVSRCYQMLNCTIHLACDACGACDAAICSFCRV
ncbi:uncharacterized protein CLUP02_11791 [Colletotrichum lupini]|uniref:Uncharacterized protein n=13 Tax=Colletotrichum TaxID=5455 RepID=A0A9Q8T0Y9_9PEZI|nr:uncharacterized protein CLUP02_11791 [Colletotrichum lupini]UQC86291.1 hypothetical protein CLUP02_11791 [Colletotrichum lupini]